MPAPNDSSKLQYLYLTTTGRVTGLPREIEIWFVESQGKLYILAEHFHKTQWVKNIERNPRVRVRLGDSEFEATARALDQSRDRAAWKLAQRLGREKYGWGDGLPVEIVPDENKQGQTA
jgi:deazaflavin-dependent oxidoreductase (nitroreductase family)